MNRVTGGAMEILKPNTKLAILVTGVVVVLNIAAQFVLLPELFKLFLLVTLTSGLYVYLVGALFYRLSTHTNSQDVALEKISDSIKRLNARQEKLIIGHAQKIRSEVKVQLKKQTDIIYTQIEALRAIYLLIKPTSPLPPMRAWAVSPDLGLLIFNTIKLEKPKVIVDLGSGVSSILSGYAVKQLREGRVISVDHDEKFLVKTNEIVKSHHLTDYVNLVHAPLKKRKIGRVSYMWYDLPLDEITNIDLLLIDGPPGRFQTNSRYPALPVLFSKLSDKATIILDDYRREDEQTIVDMWMKEYPGLKLEVVKTEKHTAILRRT